MNDNLYEDIEDYRVVMPKVSIIRKRSVGLDRKGALLDIFHSIKRKQLLPVVKMPYSPVPDKELNKNSLSVDLKRPQVRSSHTQSPKSRKTCLLPRREYQKALNIQKISQTKELSIIGNIVNNKDWVSMILSRSSFLSTEERSRKFLHSLNSKLNKSAPRIKKINNKPFRGRCLASPQLIIP